MAVSPILTGTPKSLAYSNLAYLALAYRSGIHPSQPFASVGLKGSFGSEEPIPQWTANGRLGSRTRGVQVIHAQAPASLSTLAAVRGRLSLAADRDRHFRADKPLSAYPAAQANGAIAT